MTKVHAEAKRPPRRILMVEGSSTSARQALYSLGEEDAVDLLDPNPLCQCRFSRWVNRFQQVPRYAEDPLGFLRAVAGRLKAENYDVLLPTQEQVYLLARVRDQLNALTATALPDFAALDRMQDKASFARTLVELGLPIPETRFVHSRAELQAIDKFPCYVKLAHSTAGLGVAKIDCSDSMRQLAQRLDQANEFDNAEVLVQQPAQGELAISLSIFQHGNMVAHHNASVRAFGVGTAARESVAHAGVMEDIARIGSHLAWHGALFIEYFRDAHSGALQYLEANPRMGETLNARLCGQNLVEQLIRVSLGEKVEMLAAGKIGVRSQQGYMIGVAAALEGKSRGEVFRAIMEARHQRGFYANSEDELTRPAEDWRSAIPRFAVVSQLLLSPKRAKKIVAQTVENYSLPGAAARQIRRYSAEELASCFS